MIDFAEQPPGGCSVLYNETKNPNPYSEFGRKANEEICCPAFSQLYRKELRSR